MANKAKKYIKPVLSEPNSEDFYKSLRCFGKDKKERNVCHRFSEEIIEREDEGEKKLGGEETEF